MKLPRKEARRSNKSRFVNTCARTNSSPRATDSLSHSAEAPTREFRLARFLWAARARPPACLLRIVHMHTYFKLGKGTDERSRERTNERTVQRSCRLIILAKLRRCGKWLLTGLVRSASKLCCRAMIWAGQISIQDAPWHETKACRPGLPKFISIELRDKKACLPTLVHAAYVSLGMKSYSGTVRRTPVYFKTRRGEKSHGPNANATVTITE